MRHNHRDVGKDRARVGDSPLAIRGGVRGFHSLARDAAFRWDQLQAQGAEFAVERLRKGLRAIFEQRLLSGQLGLRQPVGPVILQDGENGADHDHGAEESSLKAQTARKLEKASYHAKGTDRSTQ